MPRHTAARVEAEAARGPHLRVEPKGEVPNHLRELLKADVAPLAILQVPPGLNI